MSITANRHTRCATLECKGKRGHGITRAFCESCAERLAIIRDEYLAERTARTRRSRGNKLQLVDGVPTCTARGCMNDRVPPAAFCTECALIEAA